MTLFEVKKIKLYQMGVGWLSAKAQVNSKEVFFPILAKDQDDFLKTFHIQVEGEGMLTSVSFDTKIGQDTKIDYEGNAILSIVNLLAGSEATIELLDGKTITGTILGYQETYLEEEEINLVYYIGVIDQEHRLHHINYKEIKFIKPLDDYLVKLINDQLELMAKSRGEEEKTIRIAFDKEGEKEVTVSYVAELPAWQSSYRFYLLSEKEALFEHWAQVCNTTPQDWKDAEISLLTGMPISFKIDMSSPQIIERPVIERPTQLGVSVPSTEIEYAEEEKYEPPKRMMRAAAKPLPAPAPEQLLDKAIDLTAHEVLESAEVVQAGENIAFNLKQLITLKKGESAYLMLDSQTLPAQRKLIYNQENHKLHPFEALEVENKTAYSWSPGPATIYDSTGYLGEAFLQRVPKGEEYIVPFSLNQDITVKQTDTTKRERISVGLQGAYYIETFQTLKTFTFEVNNVSDSEKELVIELPKIYKFEVDKQKAKVELAETANYFRIKTKIPAKSTEKFKLPLIRKDLEHISIEAVSNEILEKLLALETISDKQKDILSKIKAKREEREKVNIDITNEDKKLKSIERNIKQIQGSLEVLSDKGEESKVRIKYVNKLNEAFEQAEHARKNIEVLREKASKLDKEINELVGKL